MGVSQQDIDTIVKFVKQEPRTVQEIAHKLGRSWVTADSYVQQAKSQTGLINVKTFRKGSQGALKLVFYNYKESLASDDIKDDLFQQIRRSRTKQEFDFFDIFQFIDDKKKRAFSVEMSDDLVKDPKFVAMLRKTQNTIQFFSGNMSFMLLKEGKVKFVDVIEELLERKVMIKILCRVDAASINNIVVMDKLLKRYPDLLEIRHSRQPLRGLVIDDVFGRFTCDLRSDNYRKGELPKNMKLFYEIEDPAWISWLQKVFWSLFRASISFTDRKKQLEKFL
jgi:predicted transcriptional regulator